MKSLKMQNKFMAVAGVNFIYYFSWITKKFNKHWNHCYDILYWFISIKMIYSSSEPIFIGFLVCFQRRENNSVTESATKR